ncbi:MAG: hypothetical protein JNM90_12155, partial [Burkholderiales bacterium]|nr:hypothetical protein [Burkholderiales bacterium]
MAQTARLGPTLAARLRAGMDLNVFRDAWEYRITDLGRERLTTGKGASPAFLSVLEFTREGPATFGHIAARMPQIAGDDLELWLSAMCSMGLLAPVEEVGVVSSVSAPASVADTTDVAGPVIAKGEAVAPTPTVATPLAARVLLVHPDVRVRANWRRGLRGRGLELLDAGEMEEVDAMLRDRNPAWVVIGLGGTDCEGLHLLRALKRPRARHGARVCLVVPRGTMLSPEDAETAARADASAGSLPEIVRALCGEAAVDEIAEAQPPGEPVSTAPAAPPRDVATGAPRAPANAPVWMNLLYGDAYRYGTFDSDAPSDLEAQYPRLLVRMIAGWTRPDFGTEIARLVIDDRGDRHGFPPEVM